MPSQGYGYRDGGRDGRDGRDDRVRAISSGSESRGHRKRGRVEKVDKKQKKEKKRKREGRDGRDGHREPDAPAAAAPQTAPASIAPAPVEMGQAAKGQEDSSRRGSWREERKARPESDDEDNDGMMIAQETEEDVERKLAESRARREALIAKWINRGEGEGSTLSMPDTNTSLHEDADAESDGEVAAFFAKKKQEMEGKEPEDEKALEEKRALNRFILESRGERDGDMFGDEGDDAADTLNQATNQSAAISQTGASADDWNDVEGYYKAKIGEVMAGRYLVTEDTCGKGTFSNVIKAKDQQDGSMVAIKIMRCNDMMRKAAEKEIEVLERLAAADKGNKRNVIRMLRHFMYRDHLCIVFECMWDNLRMAVKKYTKDKGMSLKAVRAYTRQLVIALQHIHRCELVHADIKPDNILITAGHNLVKICELVHADIKPDNILITAGHNLVKICDLGSAVEFNEVEPTPYLVSRFYRAPEICLGAKYGPPADIWAMGATLLELFTGKILFPGKSNNDMLRHFIEVKGKIPNKLIKSGMTWKQHFDERQDFKYMTYDKVTRKKKVQVISDCTAKRPILDMVMARVGPEKQKSEDREDQLYVKKAKEFADLLNQMTVYDPEKRATPEDLLQHPFIAGFGFGSKPKADKK